MGKENKSLDIFGLGDLAKSIPPSVYEQTMTTITSTFEKIISPLTETTYGIGRLIKQKFDNKVEIEKSLFIYALQQALEKIHSKGLSINQITNPKNLTKILDEVSQETDPLLNVLWINLLCSELTNQKAHPFFINTLSSLSAKEALLLESLNSFNDAGEKSVNVVTFPHSIKGFVKQNNGKVFEWDFSCKLLCEYGLAQTVTPGTYKRGQHIVILYRTSIGDEFLNAVKY